MSLAMNASQQGAYVLLRELLGEQSNPHNAYERESLQTLACDH